MISGSEVSSPSSGRSALSGRLDESGFGHRRLMVALACRNGQFRIVGVAGLRCSSNVQALASIAGMTDADILEGDSGYPSDGGRR